MLDSKYRFVLNIIHLGFSSQSLRLVDGKWLMHKASHQGTENYFFRPSGHLVTSTVHLIKMF